MAETSLTLLGRVQRSNDPSSWHQLTELYTPLISYWFARSHLQIADHEDIIQEVLTIVVRKLPEFERGGVGSFRAWLRAITANCLRSYFRSEKYRPLVTGDSHFLQKLHELEDPHSVLGKALDAEHDRYVVRRLLELIKPQFELTTLQAFQGVVLEGEKPASVAACLGISVNAVFLAKSKVLRRMRQELSGILS